MSKFVKSMQLTLAAFLIMGFSMTTIEGQTLSLGSSLVTINPDCTARPSCDEYFEVSETLPAWIHTISVSAGFTVSGDGLCLVSAGLNDIDGGKHFLMEVFAKSQTPGTSSIALPTPIRINPLDEVFVEGRVQYGDGECRAEAYFGIRVPPAK